jgi:hypothetical protein
MEDGSAQNGSAQDAARRRIALTAGFALAALAAIVAVALLSGGGEEEPSGFAAGSVPKQRIGDLDGAAAAAGCELRDEKSEGRGQTGGDVDYAADPPHSSDHAPEPAVDGA